MDGLIRFAQSYLNRSTQNYKGKPAVRWKYCIALEKAGYKATCETVEGSKDIVFIWQKEGEKEIRIRLSFTEQQLWLNYLQKRSAEDSEASDDKQ